MFVGGFKNQMDDVVLYCGFGGVVGHLQRLALRCAWRDVLLMHSLNGYSRLLYCLMVFGPILRRMIKSETFVMLSF